MSRAAFQRQHPTVMIEMSYNITNNIAVTIKYVRSKLCAPTTQLVHNNGNASHSGGSKLQCVLCGRLRVRVNLLRQTTQTSRIEALVIGHIAKNSAMETTAVSLHQRATITESYFRVQCW